MPAGRRPSGKRLPRLPAQARAPKVGGYLWACRDGFEPHLHEELSQRGAHPTFITRGLVASDSVPGASPAFARAGFLVGKVIEANPVLRFPDLAGTIARSLEGLVRHRPVCVQAFTPDTPAGNRLAADAEALLGPVRELLRAERPTDDPKVARELGGVLGQICLCSPELLVVGWVAAREALSLAPGGRRRMRTGPKDVSRAAAKLEEALESFGLEPGKGETCVDLGAAPGGWTARLLERGARVIAVDPASLAKPLLQHPKLTHVQRSAFNYAPEQPVDWLFCDMAWRPLEVAALLAKWGRQMWADFLVANVKLPMRDKVGILRRVREALTEGGWKGLTLRQLYHDRDEVTVTARRR
ncbi:MAG TPA: SAM-dependent methyltransferase [Myxococcales bacterium]|nr:SAM-dependent methyltransferase [Myxococcales bacterium]